MKKSLTLALAMCLSAPLAAMAQNAQLPFTQEHFNELDINKDGEVTEFEYRQFMEAAFNNLDTDRNRRLSRAEASKVLTAEQFASVDTDRNGEIGPDEFMNQAMRDFRRADHNADGSLRYP